MLRQMSIGFISLACALALDLGVASAETIYVDLDATGSNDGSSWCDAYRNLQDALIVAQSGDTVRVADGTYKPDQGGGQTPGDRSATFQLINGVTIQGGYAGCGATDPDERDVDVHETILSGDLNGDDQDESDCCYAHPGQGCDNSSCQAAVCAPYPECCTGSWDQVCAFYAGNLCTQICGGNAENSYHVVTGSGTGQTAILDGFTMTGGNADGNDPDRRGAGMYNNAGSPTLTYCTFSGNSAQVGAGMYNYSYSHPTLTNCTFSRNRAAYRGGGMYNEDNSNSGLTGCTFNENSAYEEGGGMYNAASHPRLTNCAFTDNSADFRGGGMSSLGSDPTLTTCTFTGNSVNDRGGGMYNSDGSDPTLIGCTFTGNSAGSGGGIYNYTGRPTLTNCAFIGNSAGGAGAYNYLSNPVMRDCTFTANAGEGMVNIECSPTLNNCVFSHNSGRGMHNWGGSSPTLRDCMFIANSAGGMYNFWGCNPTLLNCTFRGNSAQAGGGMANSWDSNPTLVNCVFNANFAETNGGGMSSDYNTLTLTNCIFTANSAAVSGGGIWNETASPTLANCVLWGNSDSGGTDESAQIHGGMPYVDYSCIQGWTGALGGTGNTGDDSLLADADGADDVPGTEDDDLHLSPCSPCVDAADNTALPADEFDLDGDSDTDEPIPFDLDGNPRIVADTVDMGPYEYQADAPDADGDAVPDPCDNCPSEDNPSQADADDDAVGDACDNCPNFANPEQDDVDQNEVGDVCQTPAGPVEEPEGVGKNRYISIVIPGGLGQETAIRIALTSLHHPGAPPAAPDFTVWEGEYRWVNSLRACIGGAEMGFAACTTQAECDARGLGGTCQATTICPDSLVFGSTFRCAVLGCEPEYRDWATELGGEVLHVTGAAVVPSSMLNAAQLASSCQGNEATCTAVSAELPIITTLWGNVDDDPQLSVLDVAEVVDKVKELPGALPKARVQLQPNVPDPFANVNVLDVATAVDALKNRPYGFAGDFGPCTDACPGEAPCP